MKFVGTADLAEIEKYHFKHLNIMNKYDSKLNLSRICDEM